MVVRAKFQVISIARTTFGHHIKLQPVTTGSDEDRAFWKATPGGSIELNTVNDAAMEAFGNPGDKFYIDFTKADG